MNIIHSRIDATIYKELVKYAQSKKWSLSQTISEILVSFFSKENSKKAA